MHISKSTFIFITVFLRYLTGSDSGSLIDKQERGYPDCDVPLVRIVGSQNVWYMAVERFRFVSLRFDQMCRCIHHSRCQRNMTKRNAICIRLLHDF